MKLIFLLLLVACGCKSRFDTANALSDNSAINNKNINPDVRVVFDKIININSFFFVCGTFYPMDTSYDPLPSFKGCTHAHVETRGIFLNFIDKDKDIQKFLFHFEDSIIEIKPLFNYLFFSFDAMDEKLNPSITSKYKRYISPIISPNFQATKLYGAYISKKSPLLELEKDNLVINEKGTLEEFISDIKKSSQTPTSGYIKKVLKE